MDDRPTTIQEAVRALKKRTGLSYAQMGVRAGLDGTTVHKLEKTGRGSRETITKLAAAFGEDVDFWLRLVGLTKPGAYPSDPLAVAEQLLESIEHAPDNELTYEPDLENVDVAAFEGVQEMSENDRRIINEGLRALIAAQRRKQGRG